MVVSLNPARVRHALWASLIAVYFNGMLYAVWGINIPLIREKFDLSEGTLSIALAAVAFGGIATMARASHVISLTGSRFSALLSGIMMALSGASILLVPHFLPLLVLLLIFGMFAAANDVSLNTQVASLERLAGRPLIGALHGSFSAGGLSGAILSTLWQGGNWPAAANFYIPALVGVAAIILSFRFMIPGTTEIQSVQKAGHVSPCASPQLQKAARQRLYFLGILAFSAMVVEGALYDWAAVYMRDVVKVPPGWVGYGYAAFSIGLVTGRVSGDWIRMRMAHQVLIIAGWIVAGAGLTAVLSLMSPAVVVAGFFLTGIGLANINPLVFSTSARLAVEAGIPPSEGLGITTRIGYTGLLAGPLLVGPVAEYFGLRLSLISLGVALSFTCLGWLYLSHRTDGRPWNMV